MSIGVPGRSFSAVLLLGLLAAGLGMSLKNPVAAPRIEAVFQRQVADMQLAISGFSGSVHRREPSDSLKMHFFKCRHAYKKASVFLDYFFPFEWKRINGPDLVRAEEDNPEALITPHGLQVIERIISGPLDKDQYAALAKEVDGLSVLMAAIGQQENPAYKFRGELVFDALRSSEIRLMSQGITGFDSPIFLHSLPEASATLEGMKEVLSVYAPVMQNGQWDTVRALIAGALRFMDAQKNFNSFDRLNFIRNYGDPLFAITGSIAAEAGFLLPEERRPFNQRSKSLFASDAFDINYFSPNSLYQPTEKRRYLGSLLFGDTIFSQTTARSCVSCHHPSAAYTDGLVTPMELGGNARLKRNTPTLLNAALQTRYFYDSRTATLENQLNAVVHNADEMNGSLKASIPLIEASKQYAVLFREAYPLDIQPVTEYTIANAISTFVRSLVTTNSRFDRYMRGEAVVFTGSEQRGFNLFAGKAKCATCHYLPLFNGLVPPQFTETESEVIGVPATARKRKAELDSDQGKYLFTQSTADRYAFKTPTLRNIALTAPYMHNGVFATLEEVMDFYNKGGGAGWHTAPVNETLPADPLRLSKKERRDIIAFLQTLTDTHYPVLQQ